MFSASKQGSLFGAMLLISGTCIGAGMLALPILTGLSGFLPAVVINSICWLFMVATGLLFLEATLWMPEGANLFTMSERFLGHYGKWIAGCAFLFLYYCLELSYLDALTPKVQHLIHFRVDRGWVTIGIATITALIVFLGTLVVDRINWLLMLGLIFSFCLLVFVEFPQIDRTNLSHQNWRASLFAFPALFSAFGYHNIIPSMTFYLNRNGQKMRQAILYGTLIPFIAYLLWQMILIGSLPIDTIRTSAEQQVPVTYTLQVLGGKSWISLLATFFGFFALITSLLGVSLSMVDFFADGFQIPRKGLFRFLLCIAVFLPPALLSLNYTGIFLTAIGIAGGFGEAVLNGLIPIFLVWSGRYMFNLKSDWRLPGGRVTLILLTLFTLIIMGIESYQLIM